LNPTLWNAFSKDERLSMCEQTARCDFLTKDDLLNAWIEVEGVIVGRVKPAGVSGPQRFVPEDSYWRYR